MAAVAVVRLQTYRSVFGLTMLRFGTTVFAAWLGVVARPLTQAAALTNRLCDVPYRLKGGWSWNRSRAEAYEARRVLCHWQ